MHKKIELVSVTLLDVVVVNAFLSNDVIYCNVPNFSDR